jgi:putative Mg2+ transporter-C (MgtC) family protein
MEYDILLKIFLAAILGGIVGLERELSQKEAGLRTNILIAVGSAFITILSIKIAATANIGDPARLSAQIVSGIGFLGAGAIIQARFAVHGLTTAATIWTVAAIGIGVGSGYYFTSFLVTMLVLIILSLFRYISDMLERQKKMYAYIIRIEDNAALMIEIKKLLMDLNIHYIRANLRKYDSSYEVELVFMTSETKNNLFVERVMPIPGVSEIINESL